MFVLHFKHQENPSEIQSSCFLGVNAFLSVNGQVEQAHGCFGRDTRSFIDVVRTKWKGRNEDECRFSCLLFNLCGYELNQSSACLLVSPSGCGDFHNVRHWQATGSSIYRHVGGINVDLPTSSFCQNWRLFR